MGSIIRDFKAREEVNNVTSTDVVYLTYHAYSHDFFLTTDYSRVEYYDHVVTEWDNMPEIYKSDLRSFGFAVPSRVRSGFSSSYDRVWELYWNGDLILGKDVNASS